MMGINEDLLVKFREDVRAAIKQFFIDSTVVITKATRDIDNLAKKADLPLKARISIEVAPTDSSILLEQPDEKGVLIAEGKHKQN